MENEDDWMGDFEQTPANSTQKHLSKFSKSVAAEVSNVRTTITITITFFRDLLGWFLAVPRSR